ncbi:MAG: nucleotidyltransferase domain-containing protein [Gammaproteobacteria bacterium]|nr:nucleotidyltransferase domain-containing protein [Gammaproteobacteria bacterium]
MAMESATEINPAIRHRIESELDAVEAQHGVRVLFACESGSRAWGFASPDSDYDVRFIYVHRPEWYFHVVPPRDVIELPITDELDINGWELRKALFLLRKGNAALNEWLRSPVIYRAEPVFTQAFRDAMETCYQPERAFHHYLHMALGNYREFLQRDQVRLKKYLYVLRPLLAALWIEREKTMPPMRFLDLVDALVTDTVLRATIDDLLARKRRSPESRYGSPIPRLDMFLDAELQRLRDSPPPPQQRPDFSVLDRLLFDTVTRMPAYNGCPEKE